MNSRVDRESREELGMDGRVDRESREELDMNSRANRKIKEIDKLIEEVRQVAYRLHVYLGNGLLEKVYENGLRHRLEMAGYKVESQKPLKVVDEDGFILGEYFADLLVNDSLIIELKSCKAIANEHLAQLLNYLTITRQLAGLLINFGSYRFESRVVHAVSSDSPDFHAKSPVRSLPSDSPDLHG